MELHEFVVTRCSLRLDDDAWWRVERYLRSRCPPATPEGARVAWDADLPGLAFDAAPGRLTVRAEAFTLHLARRGGAWRAHRFETGAWPDVRRALAIAHRIFLRHGGTLEGYHVSSGRDAPVVEDPKPDAGGGPLWAALDALSPRDDVAARADALLEVGDETLLAHLGLDPELPEDVFERVVRWTEAHRAWYASWSMLAREGLSPEHACSLVRVACNRREETTGAVFLGLLRERRGPPGRHAPFLAPPLRVSDAVLDRAEATLPAPFVDALHLLPGASPARLRARLANGLLARISPGIAARAVALRPDAPQELLERALRAEEPHLRRRALAHPAWPRRDALLAQARPEDLSVLAQRPELDAADLARLADAALASAPPDEMLQAAKALAAHPASTPALAARLLGAEHVKGATRGAAEGARIDDALLDRLMARAAAAPPHVAEAILTGIFRNASMTWRHFERIRDACPPGHRAWWAERRRLALLRDPDAPRDRLLALAEVLPSDDLARHAHLRAALATHPAWGDDPPRAVLAPPLPPHLARREEAVMRDAARSIEERLAALELLLAWPHETQPDAAALAPWLPLDAPKELLEPFLDAAPAEPFPRRPTARRHPTRVQRLVALWRHAGTSAPLRERVGAEILAVRDLPPSLRPLFSPRRDSGTVGSYSRGSVLGEP